MKDADRHPWSMELAPEGQDEFKPLGDPTQVLPEQRYTFEIRHKGRAIFSFRCIEFTMFTPDPGILKQLQDYLDGSFSEELERNLASEQHRVNLLSDAIVKAALAAGIVDPEAAASGLTGPQVLLLGEDLARNLEGDGK